MRRLSQMLFAVVLGAGLATPSTAGFIESISGNVNSVEDLLNFDAIDDITGIVLLGLYDDDQQDPGFVFPDGDPLDQSSGAIDFLLGDPLYFTIKAGNQTALYSWMDENDWNTSFNEGRGFSNARVWGGPTPGIPEPTAALVFGIGATLVGFQVRSKRR